VNGIGYQLGKGEPELPSGPRAGEFSLGAARLGTNA
jgi:hypothetical protein